jgi:predicted enzyme related to lactoylglutathione lyase
VTWFELNGPEPELAAKFYSELFGWRVDWVTESNYALIDTHAGNGINGLVVGDFTARMGDESGQTWEGEPPSTVFYAENPDIQRLLDRAGSLGAKTLLPVTNIPNMVTFALFADPFGNVVGLLQGDGTVKVSEGANPPVDRFLLACADQNRARDFYGELFGWKIDEGSTPPAVDGFEHAKVDTGGTGAEGGISRSPTGEPHVMMYARVDDLRMYLSMAEALGGTTVTPPTEVDEHVSIAAFRDPQGITFGLYTNTP